MATHERRRKVLIFFCLTLSACLLVCAHALDLPYRYTCWRVCHPFGPDVCAFNKAFHDLNPDRIPLLIDRLETPDGWWAAEILMAYFLDPAATPERPEDLPTRAYWQRWWESAQHQDLQFEPKRDPQF